MTAAFAARGHDGVVVPVRVSPGDLDGFLAVGDKLTNLDGIIVMVPHKFACHRHCASGTDRAAFLGAVNIMRRRKDGAWHGEMVDGLGFVGAVKRRRASIPPASARCSSAPAAPVRRSRWRWSMPACGSWRSTMRTRRA